MTHYLPTLLLLTLACAAPAAASLRALRNAPQTLSGARRGQRPPTGDVMHLPAARVTALKRPLNAAPRRPAPPAGSAMVLSVTNRGGDGDR